MLKANVLQCIQEIPSGADIPLKRVIWHRTHRPTVIDHHSITLTGRMLSFRNLASSSNVCSQQPKSQLKHFIEVVKDCLNYSVPQIQSYLKQHVKLPFYIKVSISVLFVPGISVKMCQSERWCNSTKKMLFAC